LGSLDVKEDHDASNIIYYIFLFFPLFKGCAHEVFGSSFCILLKEKWVHNVGNIFVFEELPYAIRSDNDDLVLRH